MTAEDRDAALLASVQAQVRAAAAAGMDRAGARKRRSVNEAQRERSEADLHQALVLLLVDTVAGDSGALDGLTKLAKLDFLLRYPAFLERLIDQQAIKGAMTENVRPNADERREVESRMLRYKYGPWDDRYYSIVGALVGRGLIEYVPSRGRVALKSTDGGRAIANALRTDPAWTTVAARCLLLKEVLGRMSGNRIKELIYNNLPEVVDRPHRTEI